MAAAPLVLRRACGRCACALGVLVAARHTAPVGAAGAATGLPCPVAAPNPLQSVVDDFYRRVLGDAQLGRFFQAGAGWGAGCCLAVAIVCWSVGIMAQSPSCCAAGGRARASPAVPVRLR